MENSYSKVVLTWLQLIRMSVYVTSPWFINQFITCSSYSNTVHGVMDSDSPSTYGFWLNILATCCQNNAKYSCTFCSLSYRLCLLKELHTNDQVCVTLPSFSFSITKVILKKGMLGAIFSARITSFAVHWVGMQGWVRLRKWQWLDGTIFIQGTKVRCSFTYTCKLYYYMRTNTNYADHKILVTKDLGGNQEVCKFPSSLNHSLCFLAPITAICQYVIMEVSY